MGLGDVFFFDTQAYLYKLQFMSNWDLINREQQKRRQIAGNGAASQGIVFRLIWQMLIPLLLSLS